MRKLLAALVVVAGLLAVAPLTSAPVPKKLPGAGTILVWSNQGGPPTLWLYTPDGEYLREVKFDGDKDVRIEGISADGRQAVMFQWYRDPKSQAFSVSRARVFLVDLDRAGQKMPKPIADGWEPALVWSADGKTLYVSSFQEEPGVLKANWDGAAVETEVVAINMTDGSREKLDLGQGHRIWAVSRNGGEFLTCRCDRGGNQRSYSKHIHTRGETRPLNEEVSWENFSEQSTGGWAWPVEDGKPQAVELPVKNAPKLLPPAGLEGKVPYRWDMNPRQDRVLVSWWEEVKLSDWQSDTRAGVHCLGYCDLDGKDLKVIHAPKPKVTKDLCNLDGFAWR